MIDFFNPNTICFICNNKTGLNKNKTKHGYICHNCLLKLSKKNINILNIKKYTIDELKNIIGITSKEPSLTPLENVSINLKKDEVCFYMEKAQSIKIKNVVTHYESGNTGLNIKLSKNISYHTGKNIGKAIRENVYERYPATLYITNMRIILIAEKYGFDLRIDKILSTQVRTDGLIFQIGEKTYSVLTDDVEFIIKLFNLMNNYYNNQKF